METRDDLLRPPPPTLEGSVYERRVKDAENMARYEAAVTKRADQQRRDAARTDAEAFVEARLTEWLDAGGSEAEFRAAWPTMFAGHLNAKRAPEDAQRQRLIEQQRVF